MFSFFIFHFIQQHTSQKVFRNNKRKMKDEKLCMGRKPTKKLITYTATASEVCERFSSFVYHLASRFPVERYVVLDFVLVFSVESTTYISLQQPTKSSM